MGANQFISKGTGTTVGEAFTTVREQALWEHGHGGYSGTIAEKDGYVEFTLPTGMTVDTFERVICDYLYGDKPVTVPASLVGEIDRVCEVYEDKWGPAVAVKTGEHEWTFLGYASS